MENLIILWKLIEQLVPVIPGQTEQPVHIWNKITGDVIVDMPSEIMSKFHYKNMYTNELGVYVCSKNVHKTTDCIHIVIEPSSGKRRIDHCADCKNRTACMMVHNMMAEMCNKYQ